MSTNGTYYLIRHRPALARHEERSVAVAVVSEQGDYAAVKHLPPSQISQHLRGQGIFDSALVSLGRLIADDPRGAANRLDDLRDRTTGSLVVTEGMPADLSNGPKETLDALFAALVSQRRSRPSGIQKAQVLDRTVDLLRQTGAPVARGEYLEDFLIDAIVTPRDRRPTIIHAQSFATHRDWSRAERETGYFLLAAGTLGVASVCVLQAPVGDDDDARRSFERIERLVRRTGIRSVESKDFDQVARSFAPEEQLPLLMA